MIRKALEKLNDKQKHYCSTLSTLISRHGNQGLQPELEKNKGELRGYLECLQDMEIITLSEMRSLYLWYMSEERK